jgi:hypothetical protein
MTTLFILLCVSLIINFCQALNNARTTDLLGRTNQLLEERISFEREVLDKLIEKEV